MLLGARRSLIPDNRQPAAAITILILRVTPAMPLRDSSSRAIMAGTNTRQVPATGGTRALGVPTGQPAPLPTLALPAQSPTPQADATKTLFVPHTNILPKQTKDVLFKNKLPTPIDITQFIALLMFNNYDPIMLAQLKVSFTKGFDIGYRATPNSCCNVHNLKSANEYRDIVTNCIDKELTANRFLGPFSSPPFDSFQINPLGIVPKKQPGSFRMITHLSSPEGTSINDNIDIIFSKVVYQSFQDAVKLVMSCGQHSFMSKSDIKSAFRLLPVLPEQIRLLGVKWEDNFYFDRCLPMGASSAPQLFEKVSSALHFLGEKKGIQNMVHYLDDFFIVAPSAEGCQADLDTFTGLCEQVKIPLAPEKTQGPSQVLNFLGIEIDSVAEVVRLPPDKLEKCKSAILLMLKKTKCTVLELDSLTGLLSFCCVVIIAGRAFLKRLTNLKKGLFLPKPYFKIRLNAQVKEDLRVWLFFLHNFNGVTMYREAMFMSNNTLHIFTDASKTLGFGAHFNNHWFSQAWPSDWWKAQNITLLEIVPVFLAIKSWGAKLANSAIIIHTDSEPNVGSLNSLSSEERLVMFYIREIVLHNLISNIMFQAIHICGHDNVRADKLSRLQVQAFRELHPLADRVQTKVLPLPASLPCTSKH